MIADHFYESLDTEDSQYEINEYDDEYMNDHLVALNDNVAQKRKAPVILIPINGRSQEWSDDLIQKWAVREAEINSYKSDQTDIAMMDLAEIMPYLHE
jgi:hypothetical protein